MLKFIDWNTWFIDPLLWVRPWEYPVSNTNSLWSLGSPDDGAEIRVSARLFSLGTFSCCLPSITWDTRGRGPESWTVSPIKTLWDHNEMDRVCRSQWNSLCHRGTGWSGERENASLERPGEPNIQLYTSHFSPPYFGKCLWLELQVLSA